MKNLNRFALLLCAVLWGCSHLLKQNTASQLTLSTLRRIQPGVTRASEVQTLLGAPAVVTKLERLRSKDLGEVWEYFENGATRASVSVSSTGLVSFWGWHVYEQDPEQELGTALSKFPDAHWTVESAKWMNPHSWPNECYFTDGKKGITVEFNRARKGVAMVESWDPHRNPASLENGKPPIFCIDGTCSPGLPYRKVFGDKSLCDLPK